MKPTVGTGLMMLVLVLLMLASAVGAVVVVVLVFVLVLLSVGDGGEFAVGVVGGLIVARPPTEGRRKFPSESHIGALRYVLNVLRTALYCCHIESLRPWWWV
jgi:hypothetical protein